MLLIEEDFRDQLLHLLATGRWRRVTDHQLSAVEMKLADLEPLIPPTPENVTTTEDAGVEDAD